MTAVTVHRVMACLTRIVEPNRVVMETLLVVVIVGAIVVAVIFRLIAGALDKDRIEDYIHSIGGELIDKSWAPFGPGWFGERDSRIYEIVYRDRDGRIHRAHVKTSLFSGVYLTNDRIVEEAPLRSVEEEKELLKRRLAELERLSAKDGQGRENTRGQSQPPQ
ncbi:MAG: hypothetical protein NZ739_08405 [Verrucomicrobiae bacterium]|nr:hypothetical protein [Verrucomicrobiae bacterium]MCX7723383.1 hypothetical protein [Verrucomicrobiae bacterium]MDW7979883.1 hypothetical protein [Verrucomicrobiales bacterium]